MAYTDNDLVASILRGDGKGIGYPMIPATAWKAVLDQQGEVDPSRTDAIIADPW